MAETGFGADPTGGAPVRWATTEVRRIEDLQDAVHGAGLEAVQYSSGAIAGSLSVAEVHGATFTVAEIGSHIGIRGPLHRERLTIGIGLRQPDGSRQWMRDVETGTVGVFLPDEEHDGLHAPGSRYVAIALDRARLEEVARDLDLVLDEEIFRASGLHPLRLSMKRVATLALGFRPGPPGGRGEGSGASEAVCRLAIEAAVAHLARPPRRDLLRGPSTGYARIVARARGHVIDHLTRPISVEEMARAASTSVRSLHRAFGAVLGESPASYVRRIRLHRIREGLVVGGGRGRTVSQVAYRSGIRQLGRMARGYRTVFGELPSETLKRQKSLPGRGLRASRSD